MNIHWKTLPIIPFHQSSYEVHVIEAWVKGYRIGWITANFGYVDQNDRYFHDLTAVSAVIKTRKQYANYLGNPVAYHRIEKAANEGDYSEPQNGSKINGPICFRKLEYYNGQYASETKDVDQEPYMLAVYKDNVYNHLIRHAVECWKKRHKPIPRPFGTTSGDIIRQNNPLIYCPFPPLDLIKEYYDDQSSITLLSSRLLKCPVVAKWVFEQSLLMLVETVKISDEIGIYPSQVIEMIKFDEELIYKVITIGLAPYMPRKFQDSLNEEQRAAVIICA